MQYWIIERKGDAVNSVGVNDFHNFTPLLISFYYADPYFHVRTVMPMLRCKPALQRFSLVLSRRTNLDQISLI